jgi:hypothetical protein
MAFLFIVSLLKNQHIRFLFIVNTNLQKPKGLFTLTVAKTQGTFCAYRCKNPRDFFKSGDFSTQKALYAQQKYRFYSAVAARGARSTKMR